MYSDAASWWVGWALAHPELGVSVYPFPTREADYAHHITACLPRFENLVASLMYTVSLRSAIKGVRPSPYATGVPNSLAGIIISPVSTNGLTVLATG